MCLPQAQSQGPMSSPAHKRRTLKNYADEFRAALEGKPVPLASVGQDETVAAVAEDIEQTTKDFVLKRLSQEVKGTPFGSWSI
jgi:hypothetical protein